MSQHKRAKVWIPAGGGFCGVQHGLHAAFYKSLRSYSIEIVMVYSRDLPWLQSRDQALCSAVNARYTVDDALTRGGEFLPASLELHESIVSRDSCDLRRSARY